MDMKTLKNILPIVAMCLGLTACVVNSLSGVPNIDNAYLVALSLLVAESAQ